MRTMLKVDHVSISYKIGDFKDIGLKEWTMRHLKNNYHVETFTAVNDVSFELQEGDMLGIVGSNGAGKSTLLKAVTGVMEPRCGSIERNGKVVALLELASGFDGDLTVRENAYLRGAMLGYTRAYMDKTYQQILDFSELWDFADRPFKQLSTGMQSRLAFSIASLVQPEILILDEVLSVGDGAFQEKSGKKMLEIINGGAATILVSHSLGQIRELCNKALWLDHGHQIMYGDTERVCDAYEAYLTFGGNAADYMDWQPEPELQGDTEPLDAREPEEATRISEHLSEMPDETGLVTREEVVNCYRYILGREPESEEAIQSNLQAFQTINEMRKCFLQSDEFRAQCGFAASQIQSGDILNEIDINDMKETLFSDPKFLIELRFRLSQTRCLWGDPDRLDIHPTAVLNDALLNTNCGTIKIGAYSFTGHSVSILTGSHYLERKNVKRMDYPREGRDIEIGEGVWLASGCMVLGPCRIGDHAVVCAGAVVVPGTEIPHGTVWGGNPARQLRKLTLEDIPTDAL